MLLIVWLKKTVITLKYSLIKWFYFNLMMYGVAYICSVQYIVCITMQYMVSTSLYARLDVALDYEIDVTGKYSGSYFLEEIKGLADATGLDYKVCPHHL